MGNHSLSASPKMSNLFLSFVELAGDLVQKALHRFFPVEHASGLLIALDIVLHFLLQIFVYPLVLQNAQKSLIDLTIQAFVLTGQVQMLLPQILPLHSGLVELGLS